MQITYYVAVSIDGFIATVDGSVDWLSQVEISPEEMGYDTFFATVDGLVMGRKTFEQVLSFGEWPYGAKPCWVMTRQLTELPLAPKPASIMASRGNPNQIVENAQALGVHHLWLVGGGQIASVFQNHRLISHYDICILPIILGQGIPLFANSMDLECLTLTGNYPSKSGAVRLTYQAMEIDHSLEDTQR